MKKLNLGCGFNKVDGFINIDSASLCQPDLLLDLERDPWPFEANSVDGVVAYHFFEHVGATPERWIFIWKEIWRVACHGAEVVLTVPHPRHDNFLIDPTHVRPVFPGTIAMFDQVRNVEDLKRGGQETKLGLYNGIDIEVTRAEFNSDHLSLVQNQQMTEEELNFRVAHMNNFCKEIRIWAKIHKPARVQGDVSRATRFGGSQNVESLLV